MGVDHSKALVRITFNGLFIICRKGFERWEVGIPNVPGHTAGLELVTVTGPVGPTIETPNIRFDQDITIEADPALNTEPFDAVDFNRGSDTGDPEDYRWIFDMEGPEFHNRPMTARPGGVGYKAKIFVNGGRLYTAGKTVEVYRREKTTNREGDRIVLGKVLITAGINLERDAAGSRTVYLQNNGATQRIALRQKRGVRYELNFTHMPPSGGAVGVTHFHHYYDVLKADAADTRYDVIVATPFPAESASVLEEPIVSASAHEHGHETSPAPGRESTTAPAGNSSLRFGNEPQVCNVVYLSKSSALPT